MNECNKKKKVEWRLNIIMSERKIRTVTELRRQLEKVGVCISSAQLGRIVWEKPQKLNIELLEGLLAVLECSVSDIMRVAAAPVAEKEVRNQEIEEKPRAVTKGSKTRVKPLPEKNSEDLTGPKVTPFPVPDREK